MTDEDDKWKELKSNIGDVDKLMMMTAKQARLLKIEMSGFNTFISSKNYEILSRFLSGTGAWKILNKFKATIQTITQFQSMSERADLARVEKEKKMGDLIRQRNKAVAVSESINLKDMEQLKILAENSNLLTIALDKQRQDPSGGWLEKYKDDLVAVTKQVDELVKFDEVTGMMGGDNATSKWDLFNKGSSNHQDDITYSGKKGDKRFDYTIKNKNMGQRMQAYTKIAWADAKSPFKGIKSGKFSNFLKNVKESAKVQLKFLGKALIYFALFAIGLTLLIKAFTLLKPALENAWRELKPLLESVFDLLMHGLEGIYLGLLNIWEGIKNGDMFLVLEGILQIFGGLLITVISLGLAALTLTVGLALTLIGGFMEQLAAGGNETKKAFSGIFILLGTVAMIIALFALELISWPLLIVGAVIVGIGIAISKAFGFASGGVVNSNMQLVGEKGPELVSLPRGSRVHSNADSQRMTGGSGGNTINVHVNGRVGASDAEIRDIATKVSREINLRMNRTSSAVNNF